MVSAAFGDVGASLFVASGTFGDVGDSLLKAGAILGDVELESHFSWPGQHCMVFLERRHFFVAGATYI